LVVTWSKGVAMTMTRTTGNVKVSTTHVGAYWLGLKDEPY
jgi:hypothetical protein